MRCGDYEVRSFPRSHSTCPFLYIFAPFSPVAIEEEAWTRGAVKETAQTKWKMLSIATEKAKAW